ncbi:XRE family transcriptional regulator [Carnobacterium divergens]|uniref:helix-turn-helix domain-containing protein n=1 Tax=Carnobacterium TaxID=2747 RepID=UPI0007049F5E|nr:MULTISPECIES: helix-turn-helix transcriptional regulator [Carnobacterium]KRN85914.1 hypothetical protein IV75_GL001628 [Carnobacterium maltaromaticum]TFJ45061.1 XRE family transcriptional regulator [Carnobacterium divergens]TFJ52130.1 XRE family transcriptional regulator [Carnobacterium divergens]TFJ57707.1 XRE family transcriptional regulator [Carnobacterium divergens]TFJ65722.1 XRE family transcriptional regulator [Carnobacterium divergens]
MQNQYSIKIKQARQKLNLSQVELGRKINVSQQTIASWEVGRTEPKSDNYKALSEALHVPISYFVDNQSTYLQLSFNTLYDSLDESDKQKTIEYMKLLQKQAKERKAFE